MRIGTKLFLSFFAIILFHLLTYQLIFKNIIVEQIKNDRYEQFLSEKVAAQRVQINQLMRTNSFKDPLEMHELSSELPEDLMYKVTVEDANGTTLYTKVSQAYSLKGPNKKEVAEYYFQHDPGSQERTVITFYTDESDILASKGVSMSVWYIYGSILLLGLVFMFILVRWILRPVGELSLVTQEIKDGKRYVSFSYKANDEFGQLFQYFTDMVEELRNAEERQQELIAAIAHDFRTPLTTIKGYASFIGSGRVTDMERIQNQMKKIGGKVNDLEKLLDELQDFSYQSRQLPLVLSRIHLWPFVQNIAEEYEAKAQEAGLRFGCKIRVSKELRIEADETKLRRVLENLLNNAIYYNKPEGAILLTCDQRERYVLFSVIDKGEGIAEEDINKVFAKFYRADKSRNRNTGGTGLGLAICQSIVQRHGGELSVISQLGEGSCFSFTLPFHQ
ncbi:sensor histidine kinase [Brevibacillus sp. B_LB10_24]|uniref:sensor histidine kinase n=1 Tax=Brevibacillus sp. B_LB10_24 TaxID=3380645 RepID=UPI0038B6F1B6